MAKSNYLPGILFIAALLFCGSTAGFCVEYQVSGIKYRVSGIKYQVSGIKYQDGRRKRSLYQVSGIKYQDRSAVTEYGGDFSDSWRKRSLCQVSGIKYHVSSIRNQDRGPVIGGLISLNPGGLSLVSLGFRPPASDFGLKIRVKQIYDSQIGIREQGTNSGLQIEKYLKYAGLAKGQPWCAAFVCWVLGEAGVVNPRSGWSPDLFPASKIIWERTGNSQLGTHNPVLLPVKGCLLRGGTDKENVEPFLLPVTGCVLRGWTDNENVKLFLLPVTGCLLREPATHNTQPATHTQHATRNPQLTRNRQPTTSDVFGIYFPEKKRIAHVGFIDQWDESWLITVEGNTNISGGREGDGVYRKRRLIRSIYRVARYIN